MFHLNWLRLITGDDLNGSNEWVEDEVKLDLNIMHNTSVFCGKDFID